MTTSKPKNKESEAPAEDNSLNWAKLPKAEQHELLAAYDQRLHGCHKEETFAIYGARYRLRTLDPADEHWTIQYIHGGVELVAVAKSQRAPTIAASLVAWGPGEDEDPTTMIPIADMFKIPSGLPENARKLIMADEFFERDWRRTEILRWLNQRDKHPELVKLLYDRYLSLEKKRKEALEALSPLSRATRTGELSATSSPEPAGSSPTQSSGS